MTNESGAGSYTCHKRLFGVTIGLRHPPHNSSAIYRGENLMRKLVITGLLALTLALGLTVGSARIAWSTGHIAGPAHPMTASICPGTPIPC
jgi:hypothetical protein